MKVILNLNLLLMKVNAKNLIRKYQFEDDRLIIKAVIFCNLLLGILLLISGLPQSILDERVLICLFTGCSLLAVYNFYSWKSIALNIYLVLFYSIFVMLEIIFLGIPKSSVSYDDVLSKGILLELMIHALPSIYILLRIAMVIPLIKIVLSAKQLKRI